MWPFWMERDTAMQVRRISAWLCHGRTSDAIHSHAAKSNASVRIGKSDFAYRTLPNPSQRIVGPIHRNEPFAASLDLAIGKKCDAHEACCRGDRPALSRAPPDAWLEFELPFFRTKERREASAYTLCTSTARRRAQYWTHRGARRANTAGCEPCARQQSEWSPAQGQFAWEKKSVKWLRKRFAADATLWGSDPPTGGHRQQDLSSAPCQPTAELPDISSVYVVMHSAPNAMCQ